MKIIETERLSIREIEQKDIDCLLDIYRVSKNMEFIPNSNFEWTNELLVEKYEKINQDYKNGFGIYAVELKQLNVLIGEAGLFKSFQDISHLELGYILDHKFWGNGYGTEICQSLIKYGFEKLNLYKLSARMFCQNIASIRLSEKCGMNFVKQGVTDKGEHFCEYEIVKQ